LLTWCKLLICLYYVVLSDAIKLERRHDTFNEGRIECVVGMLDIAANVLRVNTRRFLSGNSPNEPNKNNKIRRMDMTLKKEIFGVKKNIIVIAITLSVLLAATVAFAAHTSIYSNDNRIHENVVIEDVGGSHQSDESKYNFINTYPTPQPYETGIKNIVTEDAAGSHPSDENKHNFLASYSESNTDSKALVQGDAGTLAIYNINWPIRAGQDRHGVSQLSMSAGSRVPFNISWTPRPGTIRVGLFNRNTGEYYWSAASSTPPLRGTITVPETGLYSFAVGNTTDTDVTATGSFTY